MQPRGRERASTNPFDNWTSDEEDAKASDWFSTLPPSITVPPTLQGPEERARASSDPLLSTPPQPTTQPTGTILAPNGTRRCLSQKFCGNPAAQDAHVAPGWDAADGKDLERVRQSLHLLRELLDTEQGFLVALRLLEEWYRSAVVAGGFLSEGEVERLFSNAHVLVQLHQALVDRIFGCLEEVGVGKDSAQWTCAEVEAIGLAVGRAFTESLARLEAAYVEYTGNMAASRHLLELALQLEGFEECLEEAKASAAASNAALEKIDVGLSALLIRPVQRLCRYTLFFSGVLKYIPTRFKCYVTLHKLNDSIRALAGLVNEKKAESERKQRGEELRSALVGVFDEEDLRKQEFLFEWKGRMVCIRGRNSTDRKSRAKAAPASSRVEKECGCFFLFSGWLVIAEEAPDATYKVSTTLKLTEVVVEPAENEGGEQTNPAEWTLCVLHIFDTIKSHHQAKSKPCPPPRKAGLRLMKEKQKRCTVINEYAFTVGSKATYDAIIHAIAAAKTPSSSGAKAPSFVAEQVLPTPALLPSRPVFLQPPQDPQQIEKSRVSRRRPRRSSIGHAAPVNASTSKADDGKALCEALDQMFGRASNPRKGDVYTLAS